MQRHERDVVSVHATPEVSVCQMRPRSPGNREKVATARQQKLAENPGCHHDRHEQSSSARAAPPSASGGDDPQENRRHQAKQHRARIFAHPPSSFPPATINETKRAMAVTGTTITSPSNRTVATISCAGDRRVVDPVRRSERSDPIGEGDILGRHRQRKRRNASRDPREERRRAGNQRHRRRVGAEPSREKPDGRGHAQRDHHCVDLAPRERPNAARALHGAR